MVLINEEVDQFAPLSPKNPFRDAVSRGKADMGERPKIKEVKMDDIEEEDKRRASLKNMSAVSASPISAETQSIKGWQCGH